VKVRPATVDDCVDIHRVQDAAIRGIHAGKAIDQGVADYLGKRSPASYEKEMVHERFVVVVEEGEILGYGALHIAKMEITSVFVGPAHQRRGVGRVVLAALEKLARDGGIETVQLQATGTAIIFYLATGYQSDPPVEPGAEWAQMKKSLR
jgi:N-acetylglutamate synthase-like GNAT family acetyltransferase